MGSKVKGNKNQLVVEQEKKKILLRNSETTLVKLKEEKGWKMSFKIEDDKYTIGNRGFWNPETVIKKGNKKILVLRRPLTGIVAMAELHNGGVYKCHIEDMPSPRLSFLTAANVEVLSYSLHAKTKAQIVLDLHAPILSKKDLRLLIVLGCYCFSGLVKERSALAKGNSKYKKSKRTTEANTLAAKA